MSETGSYVGALPCVPPCSVSFSDVPPGYWAENYIYAIACAGITTRYPDGTYRPGNKVKPSEMAAFLARAFLEMS